MRTAPFFLAGLALAGVSPLILAQDAPRPQTREREVIIERSSPRSAPRVRVFSNGDTDERDVQVFVNGMMDDASGDPNRAWLGISTGGSGSKRDTLGLLIREVIAGSPAEKASLEEGQRLVAINGVSLRVNGADAEDMEMTNIVARRLTRALGKLKAGDEVELQVYGDGRTRTITVKTGTPPESNVRRSARAWRDESEQQAVLGVALGGTPSKRDADGVFLSGVSENGPAEKAGIVEGERVQAINGVDLRVAKEDAGDPAASSAKISRLRKALAAVKVGDEVELKVWSAGRARTVKVKTVKASELSSERRTMMFDGFTGAGFPQEFRMSMPGAPMMPRLPAMPRAPALPSMLRRGNRISI